MPTISVTIPIAGTWPSADDLSARNEIMAALDAMGFGTSIGCGGGDGAMDFSYRIDDPTTATEIVRRIVREHLPVEEPQIRIVE